MKPANRKGEMSGRFDRVQTEICKQAKASKKCHRKTEINKPQKKKPTLEKQIISVLRITNSSITRVENNMKIYTQKKCQSQITCSLLLLLTP